MGNPVKPAKVADFCAYRAIRTCELALLEAQANRLAYPSFLSEARVLTAIADLQKVKDSFGG